MNDDHKEWVSYAGVASVLLLEIAVCCYAIWLLR